ncbi:unnamed protein product, partial [Sphacelaria rigidula]
PGTDSPTTARTAVQTGLQAGWALQDRLYIADRKEAARKKGLIAANAKRKANPVEVGGDKAVRKGPSAFSNSPGEPDVGAAQGFAGSPTLPGPIAEQPVLQPAAAPAAEAVAGGQGSLVKAEELKDNIAASRQGAVDDLQHDRWAYGERPDDWLSPHSLMFAMFGRCAGRHEDEDLKMVMTSGPSGTPGKGKA